MIATFQDTLHSWSSAVADLPNALNPDRNLSVLDGTAPQGMLIQSLQAARLAASIIQQPGELTQPYLQTGEGDVACAHMHACLHACTWGLR